MPQKIALYYDIKEIDNRFKVQSESFEYKPRYNINPGQNVPIITNDEEAKCVMMRWGLVPGWSNDPLIGFQLINAKSESINQDKNFKNSLREKRCIVPCSGFYLTKRIDRTTKKLFFVNSKDGNIFGFAGLWDIWGRDGGNLTTFTIVTTTANNLIEGISDRMPVILYKEDEQKWLDPNIQDPAEVTPLLKAYTSEQMEVYEISNYVNRAENEGPGCIEPIDVK
ncbi:MAG: hypothetical protein GWN11_10515 [Candidatus Dadabacteria bacterium]|nr:hypothetical protein [Candidatus Dadabacteria bacterium]